MAVRTLVLASDNDTAWRLVFVAAEPHLYVEFARHGIEPDPSDRITVDDFLAWRPNGSLHQQALESFAGWVCIALE